MKFTIKLVLACSLFLAPDLSQALDIVVSSTAMSPDKSITISLIEPLKEGVDTNYFFVDGKKSGYWRVVKAPPFGSPVTTYELYLKDPGSNQDIVVLSFTKAPKPHTPSFSGGFATSREHIHNPEFTITNSTGNNVTGYFTDVNGQITTEAFDFKNKDGSSAVNIVLK